MNLIKLIQPGRVYVLFCRDGLHRGRVVRRDALHVDLDCDGEPVRLGVLNIQAVLEPFASNAESMTWGGAVATA